MSEIGPGIAIGAVTGIFFAYVGAITAYNHFKVDSPARKKEGGKRRTPRHHARNRTRKA